MTVFYNIDSTSIYSPHTRGAQMENMENDKANAAYEGKHINSNRYD